MLNSELLGQLIKDAPKVEKGEKFKPGRARGAFGRLTKLIEKRVEILVKAGTPLHEIKPAFLWNQLSEKPPKGYEFFGQKTVSTDILRGNKVRINRDTAHVFVPGKDKPVPYKRFSDIVGQIKARWRKKTKNPE